MFLSIAPCERMPCVPHFQDTEVKRSSAFRNSVSVNL